MTDTKLKGLPRGRRETSKARALAFTTLLCGFIGIAAAVTYWAGVTSLERQSQTQSATGTRGAHQPEPPPSDGYFVLEGDQYVLRSPAVIAYPFAAHKPERDFRVFILGGSQAMGCPFATNEAELTEDDYLGTATWLKQYLQELLPGREVEVINAALEGQDLAATLPLFDQIISLGQPDLAIFISGNNESRGSAPTGQPLSHESVNRARDKVATNFERTLGKLAAAANAAAVQTYFLTVPSNLRDWAPFGPAEPDHQSIRRMLESNRPREALAQLDDASKNPTRQFLRGRAFDQLGAFDEAHQAYSKARDQDAAFTRARSAWNSLIPKQASSRYVQAIPMEQIVAEYAKDGIPGFDLFVDNCHMNPRGHRIVALEIAKVFAAGLSSPTPQWLTTPRSSAALATEQAFDNPKFTRSAIRGLELAVKTDPSSRVNPTVLGMLYADEGRTREAREMFDRAMSTPSMWPQVPFDQWLLRERNKLKH
jgi:tetratricopeptide (TPR) repeat protein